MEVINDCLCPGANGSCRLATPVKRSSAIAMARFYRGPRLSVTRSLGFASYVSLVIFFCSFCFPVHAATLKADAGPFVPNANEFASAVVMVPNTKQILYSFKPDLPRVPASLTKLAGALAWVKRGALPYNRVVRMSSADEVGGGRLRLAVGSRMTFRDLWYSSITASANNAAMALGRAYPGGMKAYLTRMNSVVRTVGAKSTHYNDAAGMDPKNITTARDMALIAQAAFSYPDIRLPAQTSKYGFAVLGTATRKTITNTNKLLTNDSDVWVMAGKTGYLEESQYNIAVRLRPILADGTTDPRKDVLVVVLGAPTKDGSFSAAKRLAQWAWENNQF